TSNENGSFDFLNHRCQGGSEKYSQTTASFSRIPKISTPSQTPTACGYLESVVSMVTRNRSPRRAGHSSIKIKVLSPCVMGAPFEPMNRSLKQKPASEGGPQPSNPQFPRRGRCNGVMSSETRMRPRSWCNAWFGQNGRYSRLDRRTRAICALSL